MGKKNELAYLGVGLAAAIGAIWYFTPKKLYRGRSTTYIARVPSSKFPEGPGYFMWVSIRNASGLSEVGLAKVQTDLSAEMGTAREAIVQEIHHGGDLTTGDVITLVPSVTEDDTRPTPTGW
jgi:hypothetical protein